MIGADGEAELFLGYTDFKIVDHETGWIAGALRDDAGKRIGKVEIDGFPLEQIGGAKRPGRPAADEKHLAVLLAWALKYWELGGKRGEADDQVAAAFDYSGREKIRNIRNKLAKELGLDLDNGLFQIAGDPDPANSPPNCSVLIQKPTAYQTPAGGAQILGIGSIWTEGSGYSVAHDHAVEILTPSNKVLELIVNGGPIIISVIRPGR